MGMIYQFTPNTYIVPFLYPGEDVFTYFLWAVSKYSQQDDSPKRLEQPCQKYPSQCTTATLSCHPGGNVDPEDVQEGYGNYGCYDNDDTFFHLDVIL